jgi:hypothetical protein
MLKCSLAILSAPLSVSHPWLCHPWPHRAPGADVGLNARLTARRFAPVQSYGLGIRQASVSGACRLSVFDLDGQKPDTRRTHPVCRAGYTWTATHLNARHNIFFLFSLIFS